jgi:predicted DNA-binding protein (MmcQ/YjbR family)
MDHKTVEEHILSMPNVKLDYPFGEGVAVYQVFVPKKTSAPQFDAAQGGREERTEPYIDTVKDAPERDNTAMREEQQRVMGFAHEQADAVRGDWKMFALIQEGKEPVRISLKCDPQLAVLLREKYESVMEGYHLNKKHWNTIVLSGQLPWEEIRGLIRHSYDLVAQTGADTPSIK